MNEMRNNEYRNELEITKDVDYKALIERATLEVEEDREVLSVNEISSKLDMEPLSAESVSKLICLVDEMTEGAIAKLENEDYVIDAGLMFDRFGNSVSDCADDDEELAVNADV